MNTIFPPAHHDHNACKTGREGTTGALFDFIFIYTADVRYIQIKSELEFLSVHHFLFIIFYSSSGRKEMAKGE